MEVYGAQADKTHIDFNTEGCLEESRIEAFNTITDVIKQLEGSLKMA